jgi:hypothetical protein
VTNKKRFLSLSPDGQAEDEQKRRKHLARNWESKSSTFNHTETMNEPKSAAMEQRNRPLVYISLSLSLFPLSISLPVPVAREVLLKGKALYS